MTYSAALRAEIRQRAEEWAKTADRISYRSLGAEPTILFKPTEGNRSHGNFHDKSWAAIQSTPEWRVRLGKPHSQSRALPEAERPTARELDSSNSSDALLMNCFCFPRAAAVIVRDLGLDPGASRGPLVFGAKPKVILTDGAHDSTEIDLQYGSLFFEAKLTEADFTSRPRDHVRRYAALDEVFDVDRLPGDEGWFSGYQVIRNVLAAHQHGASSIVLIDERRPDLRKEWRGVTAAIRDARLSIRCQIRTWQQVAKVAPPELAEFLHTKYGI